MLERLGFIVCFIGKIQDKIKYWTYRKKCEKVFKKKEEKSEKSFSNRGYAK